MSKTVPKRLVAWLLAAMVALVVAPSAAFADDLTAGSLSVQDGGGVLKVYQMAADGTSSVAKDFTQADLDNLASKNTEPAKYLFTSGKGGGKKKLTVAYVTKYVTIDQIVEASGVTFSEGCSVFGIDTTDTGKGAFKGSEVKYADMKDGKFFPAYTKGEKSTERAEATPGVLALEYYSESSEEDSVTAGSLLTDITTGTKVSELRNFWGKTVDNVMSDNIGGNPYVSGLEELYFTTPFGVYTSTGNGDKKLVKQYTPDELKALAETASAPANAKGFLFNKEGWQVGVATSYIPIEKLLSDAGAPKLADGMLVKATASDGFSSNLSYDQIANGKYFYPAATSSALSADGAEEVGTVLALTWGTGAVSTTAGEAKVAVAEDTAKLASQTRIFTGLRSVNDDQTGGNRFATGPVEITVVTQKSITDASVTVSDVEKSYTYTGSAIEPAIIVKDGSATLQAYNPDNPKKGGDYKVSYENNTAVGIAKIIIEGMNAYKDKKTIEFKIAKAASSISIAKQSKVFTNKAIAYSGKVTKAGSTGAVTYKYYSDAKCTKAVKAANVKKAGTYYVKAVLAGDSNYKAATSAAVKLTVKKAANKVTAKKTSVSKSFNAAKKTGKLAKTKKVALPKVTAKFGTAKWKVSAKDKKGVLTLKSGKVVVKKGANKGTYTIKLQASVAKTANYKAASTQVVKVTVKVK